jgi:hypothetical protein
MSPAVIQKYNMELFRSVYFARLTRSADHRIVTSELLPCSNRSEHREKQREIAKFRHYFLDAHERNMDIRKRGRQASVPLVFGDRNHPGFGNCEIRSANADVCLAVSNSHITAHGDRKLFWVI